MSNYFKLFNYSLANEDTGIELNFIREFAPKTIVAIGGSGTRCLPLLNSGVKKVFIVDTSDFQLKYIEFKLELIKKLDLPTYKKVMGYVAASESERLQILQQAQLTDQSKGFIKSFDRRYLKKGFIYLGRWERAILRISRVIRFFLGVDFNPLFQCGSIAEQQVLFKEIWPDKKIRFLIKMIAHPKVLNFLLYKGHLQNSAEQKPLHQDLADRFYTFFNIHLASKSFFIQLLFLGEIRYAEGLPIEVTDPIFNEIKNYSGEIQLIKSDLNSFLKQTSGIDFISGSDIISYLNDSELCELSQIMASSLVSQKFMAIFRSFKRHPAAQPILEPYIQRKLQMQSENQDLSVVYQFHIYKSL